MRAWLDRHLPKWLTFAPCELFFAWLAIVKGVPAAIGIDSSINGPESGYPRWLLVAWGVEFVAAGSMIAYGLARNRNELRFGGFIVLAVATLANMVGIIAKYGQHRPAYLTLYVGFLLSCIVKLVSITRGEAAIDRIINRNRPLSAGDPDHDDL